MTSSVGECYIKLFLTAIGSEIPEEKGFYAGTIRVDSSIALCWVAKQQVAIQKFKDQDI